MKATVYSLSHPDTPDVPVYVGSTSQTPQKRLSDNISQARHRRRGYAEATSLAPIAHWLLSLVDEHVYPHLTVLAEFDNIADAKAQEQDYIHIIPNLLNVAQSTKGGRKPGSTDSARARRNKRMAWVAREPRTLDYAYERRRAEGYPHPEQPCSSPANTAHRDYLENAALAEERHAAGYPAPYLSARHEFNQAHYSARLAESITGWHERKVVKGEMQ
jgi:hypothetical protein